MTVRLSNDAQGNIAVLAGMTQPADWNLFCFCKWCLNNHPGRRYPPDASDMQCMTATASTAVPFIHTLLLCTSQDGFL
jgi:hypothetical protein